MIYCNSIEHASGIYMPIDSSEWIGCAMITETRASQTSCGWSSGGKLVGLQYSKLPVLVCQ